MHPDQDWCTAKLSIIDLTSLLCIKAHLMCHCYNAHNSINKICLKSAKLNLHYKNVTRKYNTYCKTPRHFV